MEIFKKHPHWPQVMEVCQKLNAKGFKAWLAGGCVRDAILNIDAKDFDIATDARPEDVQGLFPNSLDIGKQFGIIMVPFEDFQIEIATFRSDGEYKDGRHPTSVSFSSPEEDAKRRDFTINAMFYDPVYEKLHDFVEGQKDLGLKILKAVGEPVKRFEEDKLRMLRAVRFSAQLGFEIESNTLTAIQMKAPQIHVVSKERIYQELKKLFESKELIKGLNYFYQSNLDIEVLRTVFKNNNELAKDSSSLLSNKIQSPVVRWALYFYPFFKRDKNQDAILEFLNETKFPKEFSRKIQNVFEKLSFIQKIEKRSKGEVIVLSHAPDSESFIEFYGELISKGEGVKEKLESFVLGRKLYPTLPKPLLNGHDLMTLGFSPGQEMGEKLQKAYHHQLENKISNKEVLINWLKTSK